MNLMRPILGGLLLMLASSLQAFGPFDNPFDRGSIRICTANLTSGNGQNYDLGHGIRILRSAHCDIILLQEFNYKDNSDRDFAEFSRRAFGSEFFYFREEKTEYSIPNGIASRFPIAKAGTWNDPLMPNRGYAWAKIELPDGTHLYAYSVHFSAGSRTKRTGQATELVRLIKKHVPDWRHQLFFIGGDFNTRHFEEPALEILEEITGQNSIPVDVDGQTGTNANQNRPYDLILESPEADKYLSPVDLRGPGETLIRGMNYFEEGFIVDSNAFTQDIRGPARSSDILAAGMQHLLVVKELGRGLRLDQVRPEDRCHLGIQSL